MVAYGLYSVFEFVEGSWWSQALPGTQDWGEDMRVSPRAILIAVLVAGISAALYKLYNLPRWADFLIETENELRKVSWASRRQVVNESIVVVATVVILGIYIFSIDTALITLQSRVPNWLGYGNWNAIWDALLGHGG